MGSLGIVPNLGQIYNPDSFTGDGSNTTFTLTHLVTTDQSIIWVEGGVVQKPGIDFTISGLTLTRTTAPVNLVACFAMYLGVSIDVGTIADSSVTLAKMAVNSVDSDQYVDGSIDAIHLSANSVDSDAYVDGSIDAVHMSANSIDSDSYVDGSIDAVHLSANSVDSDSYVDASIDLAHMSSQSVDEDNLHISNSGSNGEFLSKQSGDAGGLTWAAAGGGFTQGTEQATTSGTSFTFGSIPAGVQMIVIHLFGVSFPSATDIDVTIGDAGGLETSGYFGSSMVVEDNNTQSVITSTSEFIINGTSGSDTITGAVTLTLEDSANFTWIQSHSLYVGTTAVAYGGGSKTLSGELTQLTIAGGTFDAGAVNIMYI